MDFINQYSTDNVTAPRSPGISTGAMATMSTGALLLAFGMALLFPVRDIARHHRDTPLVTEDGIEPYARHIDVPPPRSTVFIKDGDNYYHWHRDCQLLYFQSQHGHRWKIHHEPRRAAELHGKTPCFYCEELDRMERQ